MRLSALALVATAVCASAGSSASASVASTASASAPGSASVSASSASAAPALKGCEPRYYNRHSHVDSWHGIHRPKSFVKRRGTRLVLDGRPYVPVGVNAYCKCLRPSESG